MDENEGDRNYMGLPPVKYWENRTPPESHYHPIDPCSPPPPCNINLRALSEYAKQTGRKIIELSYEEVQRFALEPEE